MTNSDIKKRFIFQFAIPSLMITCLYVIGLIFVYQKSKNIENLSDFSKTEKILYEIYRGKCNLSQFLKLKQNIRSQDIIINLALKFGKSYILKDFKDFLDYYASNLNEYDTIFDAYLMKILSLLISGKDNLPSDYNPPYAEIKFKVNIFMFYKLKKKISPEIVKNNVKLYFELKRLGIYYHDRDYLDFAEEIFSVLEKAVGEKDPEVMSWYGSVLTKFALHKSSPIDKVEYVKRGVKLIDRATALAPYNMIVRLVRVYNYTTLPRFFKKTRIGLEDAEFLINCYFSHKPLEVLNEKGDIKKIYISGKVIMKMLIYLAENKNIPKKDRERYLKLLKTIEEMKSNRRVDKGDKDVY